MSEIPTLQEAEERGPQVQGLPGVQESLRIVKATQQDPVSQKGKYK